MGYDYEGDESEYDYDDDASTPTWWNNDDTGRRFILPEVLPDHHGPTAKIKVTPPAPPVHPPPPPTALSAQDTARLRVSTFLPPRRHSWMSG